MEQFVGLDVSQKLTHVCVLDQKGRVVWRGTCLSTPEDIAAAFLGATLLLTAGALVENIIRPRSDIGGMTREDAQGDRVCYTWVTLPSAGKK